MGVVWVSVYSLSPVKITKPFWALPLPSLPCHLPWPGPPLAKPAPDYPALPPLPSPRVERGALHLPPIQASRPQGQAEWGRRALSFNGVQGPGGALLRSQVQWLGLPEVGEHWADPALWGNSCERFVSYRLSAVSCQLSKVCLARCQIQIAQPERKDGGELEAGHYSPLLAGFPSNSKLNW